MNRSLSFMVATGLVALTTLLAGTYSIIEYSQQKREMRARLDALARLQVRATRVALEKPVWNIDRPQIEKVIEAMAEPKSVYAMRVVAAGQTFGRQRDADWKLVPWTGRNLPRDLTTYDGTVTFSGSQIGEVRLYLSPRLVNEDLRALRMRLMTTVLVADALLVLAVYLLMSRIVLEPVRSIDRYAAAVSSGGTTEPPAPAAAELSNLRHSIETMVHRLREETSRRAESEEWLLSIFDAVNDAIVVRNLRTGALVDANRGACEMLGLTREQLFDVGLGGMSSGEDGFDMATAAAVMRDPLNTGTLHEWRVRHRDGHAFWIEANLRHAEIGGEHHVILAARDITQRRKMEETVRRSERMSAIGTLVAGVAHEVRNPLFGITASLDAFEAEFGTSAETAEYMTTLRRDVARLTRLMDDLLQYGTVRPLARHVQALEPVIAEALRVCMLRAREKNADIETRIEHTLPAIAIDADRMVQVLKNLIENAIDFSPDGDTVTIDAYGEGGAVVVAVSDHGSGFRAEDVPHLFEPFFTRRRGGSGLGLAIVQKIVSEHGGEVIARNEPGGGACIEVRLPA
ncbi:MAG TPA: ATP-binding protein [Thermoanaerobaculia bacterium]|nr:ATP-binding protein [Thermoanaerobaculia bacterium]